MIAALALGLAASAVATSQTASTATAQLDTAPRRLTGHGGPVRAAIILADGRTLVTAGLDSAIIVWDLTAGTARRVLRFHDGAINALAALTKAAQPAGTTNAEGNCFASAGEDKRIALWCGTGDTPIRLLTGHAAPVAALQASAEGRSLASGSWDGEVRLWSLVDAATAPRILTGHKGPVTSLAFLPTTSATGAALVTASYDGLIQRHDLEGGTPVVSRQFPSPINAVLAAPVAGVLAAGADGRVLRLGHDLSTAEEILLEHGPLTALALAPDGRSIATAGMRTPVTLIDLTPLRTRAQILGPGLPVWALTYSKGPTSEIFTGGADRAIRRWNPANAAPSGIDIAEAPSADPTQSSERGARVFRACQACHGLTAADTNRAGPTLYGLFDRRIGTAPGYAYSEALKRLDIVWTPATVARLFEIGPAAYTPGTKMPDQKVTDPADRAALVEWLARATQPASAR